MKKIEVIITIVLSVASSYAWAAHSRCDIDQIYATPEAAENDRIKIKYDLDKPYCPSPALAHGSLGRSFAIYNMRSGQLAGVSDVVGSGMNKNVWIDATIGMHTRYMVYFNSKYVISSSGEIVTYWNDTEEFLIFPI